jgi:ethanolamine transporter EutH
MRVRLQPCDLGIFFPAGCTADDSATEAMMAQMQVAVSIFSIPGSFGLLTAIDRRRYDWRWQLAGLVAIVITAFVNSPWFG